MTVANRPNRIMVPIDVAHPRPYALRYACMIARLSGADIVVAFSSEEPGHSEGAGFAEESEEEMKRRFDRELAPFIREHLECEALPESVLGIGEPGAVLIGLAREYEIDLIVMSPHRRNALSRRLVPGVAAKLIHEAPCAVICVPPDKVQ